ncbi:MAG: pentapeptide repeat-containing protein [Verrucomicrobiales bacterium]
MPDDQTAALRMEIALCEESIERLRPKAAALAEEAAALEAELQGVQRASRRLRPLAKGGSLSKRRLLGRGLRAAASSFPMRMQALVGSIQERPLAFPSKEIAAVAEAVAARVISKRLFTWTLGFVAGVPALVSLILLIQQNQLLHGENATERQLAHTTYQVDMLNYLYETGESVPEDEVDPDEPITLRPLPAAAGQTRSAVLEDYVGSLKLGFKREGIEDPPPINLSAAQLVSTSLERADLTGVRFDGAYFDYAVLAFCDLAGDTFHGASMTSMSIQSTMMPDCVFEGADLRRTLFQGGGPSVTDLAGAAFKSCRMEGVQFLLCGMRRVVFENCDLRGAAFTQAYLRQASFRGSNLAGADLSAAEELAEADLRGAFYDAATAWPDGFDPQAAGAVLRPE